jgi:amidase
MMTLHKLPAHELAEKIANGAVSSKETTEHFIDRIDRHNPAVNAIIDTCFDAALKEAEAADAARAKGDIKGPLHGLPMTIKDLFEVEGLTCDAGFPEFKGHVSTQDSVVAARLKAAGAIIIGKSNAPLAGGDIQTYNAVHGTTNNPHNLAHTPGGSSGGSSAALSSGMTPLEYGSDIGGSIRAPAHFTGLFGHKPTFNIVPMRGHVPPPHGLRWEPSELTVAGPLARTAHDLELALDATIGLDEGPMRQAMQLKVQGPRHATPQGLRVGLWPTDPACEVETAFSAAIEQAAKALEAEGAALSTLKPDFDMPTHFETYMLRLSSIIGSDLPPEVIDNLKQVVADAAPDDTSMRIVQARGITLSHGDWLRLSLRKAKYEMAWRAVFERVDVLLCPVTPSTAMAHDHDPDFHARRISVNGSERSYFDNFFWAGIATLCGLPSTVVPLGKHANGLPFGMQIIGPAYEDKTPLAVAKMLENIGYHWIEPEGY